MVTNCENTLEMDSIIIRRYKPEDHGNVIRIFSAGNNEHIKNGVTIGRKNPRVICYFILLFAVGLWYSLLYGILALNIGFSIHFASVFFIYKYYVQMNKIIKRENNYVVAVM